MRTQERFVVVKAGANGCQRRTYTDYLDAATVAKRCGRSRTGKPCFLLHGPIGAEKLIGKCAKTKCTKTLSTNDHAQLSMCRAGTTIKQARRAAIAARAKARGLSGRKRRKR